MTSDLLLANSYIAIAALAPASTGLSPVPPPKATHTTPPPKRVAGGPPAAVTPASTRVRADRADGRLSLTFV